jgi:LmbE family N-acetylglucosaminyl deacetylase
MGFSDLGLADRRLPRRRFLSAAAAAAGASLAGDAPAGQPSTGEQGTRPADSATILAIGAHYDDCAFGISGLLLQAVAKSHRVIILSLIGDYTNWKPVRGRAAALVEGTRRIAAEYGAESRFLPYASGRIPVDDASARAVADVVADVKPGVAFMLWPHDQHPDHEATAAICTRALRLGDRVRADPFAPYAVPRRVYQYDNGPRHTIGFVPNTFVDVTTEFPRSLEWLGRLMSLVRDEPYAAGTLDNAQRLRETLVRYRGATCGVSYAEALTSLDVYPQTIF